MSDEAAQFAEQEARDGREAFLVSNRLRELHENPLRGSFDVEHLKAVHAYIFQDLPEHQPGVIRERTEESWVKHRSLEGQSVVYDVHYAHDGIEAKLTDALRDFGGPDAIRGQSAEEIGPQLAELYGDLDYAHGFYEGNSRTLREFTRELALEAGYALDWIKTDIGTEQRNELYLARDLAVLERAFPDLTPERAMQTTDRAEYEASFVITGLRQAVGEKSLDAIIREGLTLEIEREREIDSDRISSAFGEHAAIMVTDAAARVLGKLADLIADILSLGAMSPAPEQLVQHPELEQIAAREELALANVLESMDRGEGLNIDDVRNLSPHHLVNIASKGDDYLRMLAHDAGREREADRDYRSERER